MPYLFFSKKKQNLKLSSAANYRWHFKGKYESAFVVVVVVSLLWHFSADYELIVQSSLVLLHLLQNS